MDFSQPPSLQALLDKISQFVESELFPLERTFLLEGFNAVMPGLAAARERVKELGLWAPNHPTEHGGMGLDLMQHAAISKELGRSPLGHYAFGCQAPDAGNIELLHQFGSPEQKERWLDRLVSGEVRSCFGMTEPQVAGSNPNLIECRARRDGDDYVLDGQKWFTSGADGAALCIVMAVTNPDAPKYQQASMILVPTDTPGFERVRNTPVMGHAGEGYFSHSEVSLRDCRVPVSALLGPEGKGFTLAQTRLGPGRIHHCMRWLGICQRALELMCARAATRLIAPGEMLADKQIIRAWIAESAAEMQAAELMVQHAAWTMHIQGNKAARHSISMIKFYVAGVLQRVVDRALQVHGALGMTDDTVLAFFYREERASRIYDGPDEVHKMSLARQILKSYR